MALPLQNRSTSDQIYGYLLSSSYKSPWVYSPNGFDLKNDDIWETVRNQTDLLAEIIRRDNNIVRPWRVSQNHHASFTLKNKLMIDQSKQLSAICHEGISHCTNLDEARVLLSESFFTGRKYGMILWEPVYCSLDGTPPMLWYLPFKIKDVDRRRIHYVPDWVWVKPDGGVEKAGTQIDYMNGQEPYSQMVHPKGGYLRKSGIHLEMFNTDNWQWQQISQEQRRNLIECVYFDEEDRIGHGRGVLEAGFFTHYFLTGTIKKIVEGIDRYANGILIGRLDSLRNASTSKTNEAMVSAMKSVMNTFRSEHYLLLGDGDDVELKESSGSGFNVSMEFKRDLVQGWARLCNGSIRAAGHSDGTGAKAAASEEGDTSEAYYQMDRNRLDHDIDRDLLGSFLYHNQDNFNALGLAEAKRPKFTSEQIKRQSPEVAINVMSQAKAMGMDLLRTEAYDKIDMTPPVDGDDVIEGTTQMMGGEGMMGPDGTPIMGDEDRDSKGTFAPKGKGNATNPLKGTRGDAKETA